MTSEISFETAKGTAIRLFVRTETPNLADHTVMNPCWDLMVAIGDKFPMVASVVEHPEYGLCIRNGTLGDAPFLAPVPADARETVRSVAATYEAERDRRYEETKAADDRYEERRNMMRRVLGSACVDE